LGQKILREFPEFSRDIEAGKQAGPGKMMGQDVMCVYMYRAMAISTQAQPQAER
jgi:hypothetical protein